jgi:alpha-N-arabinofuranosidase
MPSISSGSFTAHHGVQTESNRDEGHIVGWIEHGDWVLYDKVEFGQRSNRIEIRASSATRGGVIEIRLDAPDGELLGTCTVPNTGGWYKWDTFKTKIKPVSGSQKICMLFKSYQPEDVSGVRLWYACVDQIHTTLWAQFKDINPKEEDVEINVRQSVFYPDKPGRNYITVRGFTMMHAATNWAPPTAEQIGLIGTHWSKGWIIEDNDIRYSTCTGVTLGKHGDEYDNTSANSADGYVKTIERATQDHGWSRETIGHHMVRHNHISQCEQAGIVGSLGAVFSTITHNEIHDIHVRQLFTGAEMAGIKFHGAIDTEISHNHIYRTNRGIWLDWMSQGTRVTGNLLHDNGPSEDIFVEVNHGPFVADNNLLLSPISLLVNSQGCAYVHNLIAGRVCVMTGEDRKTPYLKPHSTEVAGLAANLSGDERYYNNLIVNKGLAEYDPVKLPMFMGKNVYLNGAKPSQHESEPLVLPAVDPGIKLVEQSDGMYLHIDYDRVWTQPMRPLVTTELLGKAKTPDLPYMNCDGAPLNIDKDYFGEKRDPKNPSVGPFENSGYGRQILKVWKLKKGDLI